MKGSKDLFMHAYATDYRLALVIENRVSLDNVSLSLHIAQFARAAVILHSSVYTVCTTIL